MPFRYGGIKNRFDLNDDARNEFDTSYSPMFLSGGMQRNMGVQGAIARPMGGYNTYGMGSQAFGSPVPVGYGFNGYGGGVQGRIAMPMQQQGPWSGYSAMTDFGNRVDARAGTGATFKIGLRGIKRYFE